MRLQIDYEWYVESCEDEYATYPIKFKLKYFNNLQLTKLPYYHITILPINRVIPPKIQPNTESL